MNTQKLVLKRAKVLKTKCQNKSKVMSSQNNLLKTIMSIPDLLTRTLIMSNVMVGGVIFDREKKVEDMYKIKSLIDTGANVAFHTDGAVFGGILEMIYDATTRLDAANETSKVRGEEECITGEQSLKCLTTNVAYALNSDSTTGVIKVGEPADFSIYNKDYRKNEVATNLDTFKTAIY